MSERNAELVEIFSSFQGEGLLIGLRQAFIRFYACNLSCEYCDTVVSEPTRPPEFCLMEKTPGRRDFSKIKNPLTLNHILTLLQQWQREWPGIHHSISITGGEPLLYCEILKQWLPELRSILPIYLETNGILHNALPLLIKYIDHISMDIKLPSTTGCAALWENHRLFLQIASQKNLVVKVVISSETQDWEIIKSCEIIASVDKKIPLIMQPVTMKDGKSGISSLKSLELQELACKYLNDIRIIPQTHKFLGHL
jgi:7-carboxy-7-deazaguanine synthase